MKKLKVTFESLGFKNVVTYINSGNIVFETIADEQDVVLENKIEKAIKKDFLLDIKVLLRSFESIKTICKKLPDTWVKSETMRTDVLFLWEKFDHPTIIEQLALTPVDHVKYVSGALLWNVEGENYNKSGMQKLLGTELYRNMTIRNVNTVRKIYQIMNEIDGRSKTTDC